MLDIRIIKATQYGNSNQKRFILGMVEFNKNNPESYSVISPKKPRSYHLLLGEKGVYFLTNDTFHKLLSYTWENFYLPKYGSKKEKSRSIKKKYPVSITEDQLISYLRDQDISELDINSDIMLTIPTTKVSSVDEAEQILEEIEQIINAAKSQQE